MVVIEGAGISIHRAALWLCRCECGKERVVSSNSLRRGLTQSCGCLSAEKTAARALRHGHATDKGGQSRVYSAWSGMKSRCSNPRFKQWKDYGGRGIKVCQRWQSFTNFLEDMGEPAEGESLDRIDPNKGYSPDNVRWASQEIQANNKRTALSLTIDGCTQTVTQWCNQLGLKRAGIYRRFHAGEDVAAIIAARIKGCA